MRKQNILFISPAFFGYEISITEALLNNGYNVDFFDERTSNKSFFKAIFRIRKTLLDSMINSYYKNILGQISVKKYDFFLLIKGEVVPEWFLKDFKRTNPLARLIYYTYDSFNNNNSNSINILKYFDEFYSFDFNDVKKNSLFKLKHLFYTSEFINSSPTLEKKYKISFIGTLHSDRYKTVKKLFTGINKTFVFFYSPAKWFFAIEKLARKDYRNIQFTEISFDKISRLQVAEIFKSSEFVLDIQRSGQTGLTMRTFEVLAAGAILVTTNENIKQADFFDSSSIIIIEDPGKFDLNIETLIKEFPIEANNTIAALGKYHVDNWVKEFFTDESAK